MAFKMKGPTLLKMTSALKNKSPMKDQRQVWDFLTKEEAAKVNAHNRDHSMGIDHPEDQDEETPVTMKSALKHEMKVQKGGHGFGGMGYMPPVTAEDVKAHDKKSGGEGHTHPNSKYSSKKGKGWRKILANLSKEKLAELGLDK